MGRTIREEDHITKKCPQCYTFIPLQAQICPSCKARVGKVDKHGMATRRIEWASYIICFLAWLALGLYIYFAFIKS